MVGHAYVPSYITPQSWKWERRWASVARNSITCNLVKSKARSQKDSKGILEDLENQKLALHSLTLLRAGMSRIQATGVPFSWDLRNPVFISSVASGGHEVVDRVVEALIRRSLPLSLSLTSTYIQSRRPAPGDHHTRPNM